MQTFDQRVFRTGFSAKAPRLRWVARALPLSRPTNGEVLRQHCLVMGGSATSRSGAWLRVAIGSQIAGLCENRDQSARQQPTGSSNRDTIERCVTSSLREREAHDETRRRPRFGQVFLGLFRRVIGSKEGRFGCAPSGQRPPLGATNSQWQRTEETRLQCSEPGRLKDHCEDGEQPNAKEHRGELDGVIS